MDLDGARKHAQSTQIECVGLLHVTDVLVPVQGFPACNGAGMGGIRWARKEQNGVRHQALESQHPKDRAHPVRERHAWNAQELLRNAPSFNQIAEQCPCAGLHLRGTDAGFVRGPQIIRRTPSGTEQRIAVRDDR